MTVLERLSAALGDRYTIEREIGEGGMATVYLARDVRHDRRVAIKVLHPELSAMLGPDRFLSEIKLTASLQHPHILPLFDSGVADGLLYYVMPFVEGETLRRRLEREHQLPVADAVRLASEIADALHYAHEQGVVHRDIKPENVLLQSGRAVVADFGIALAVHHAGGMRMTQTGMSLGTPQYMAPEQAMGERNIDARADVYALGAVTYEMLAGEPPFTGPTAQAIVARVMTERPRPLRTLRDTVPEYIEIGVATALEKLPADRHATAALFAESLDRLNATKTMRASGTRPASRNAVRGRNGARIAAIAAVALLAGGVIGAFAMQRADGSVVTNPGLPLRFAVAPPDSVRLRLVCCGQIFAISPNGRWLVFQGSPQPAAGNTSSRAPALDRHQLYLRDLTDLSTRALAGTDDAEGLFFSPNGDEIGFITGRTLKRMPLTGAAAQTVATLPEGFVGGATWGSDGTIVAGVGGTVVQVSAGGGVPTPLFPSDTSGLQYIWPQWNPRERTVVYARATQAQEPVIEWRSLKSNAVKTVAPGAAPTYVEALGALLVVRSDGALMQYPFDMASGDTTGPGVRIAGDVVRRSPIVAHGEYSASSTGTIVLATRRANSAVLGASLVTFGKSTAVKRVMQEFMGFTKPSFSPTGDRVAVIAARDQGGYSLQLYDVARDVTSRAPVEGDVAAVGWSGSGDSLVYRTNAHDLRVRAADGSGTPTPVLSVRGWNVQGDGLSAWGPWIAFSASQPGALSNLDIAIAHRDSLGNARPYAATAFMELSPAISPDGKWLAYTSNENRREDVWVSAFPVPSGRYLVSTAGGRTPYWSNDSRTLYFGNDRSVYSVAFTPGTPPTLGAPRTVYSRDPWGTFAVSPDKSRIMIHDRVREGEPQALVINVGAVVRKAN